MDLNLIYKTFTQKVAPQNFRIFLKHSILILFGINFFIMFHFFIRFSIYNCNPTLTILDLPLQASKSEVPQKLKSIIISNGRRLGSQDSSEKHVTFQESGVTDGSIKKKVTFADNTVFEQEPIAKRGRLTLFLSIQTTYTIYRTIKKNVLQLFSLM